MHRYSKKANQGKLALRLLAAQISEAVLKTELKLKLQEELFSGKGRNNCYWNFPTLLNL